MYAIRSYYAVEIDQGQDTLARAGVGGAGERRRHVHRVLALRFNMDTRSREGDSSISVPQAKPIFSRRVALCYSGQHLV